MKKIKIRKTLITLLLTTTISLSPIYGLVRAENLHDKLNTEPTEEIEIFLDNQEKDPVETIEEKWIEKAFLYNTNWDLVVYKGKVGFVYHNSIKNMPHDITQKTTELKGYIIATATINVRLGPNTDYISIRLLKKDTKAEVLGKTNNNWYIIRIDNQIGYVSGEYTKYYINQYPEEFSPLQETEEIEETETAIEEIEETKKEKTTMYVYTTTEVNFREQPDITGLKIGLLEKIQN